MKVTDIHNTADDAETVSKVTKLYFTTCIWSNIHVRTQRTLNNRLYIGGLLI